LYEDIFIVKEFSRHQGSTIILYLLWKLKQSHKIELMRFVGSQKATNQALEWLLKMKMVQYRRHTKEEGAKVRGFYSLTPSGAKIAESLNACMMTVIEVYRTVADHRHKS